MTQIETRFSSSNSNVSKKPSSPYLLGDVFIGGVPASVFVIVTVAGFRYGFDTTIIQLGLILWMVAVGVWLYSLKGYKDKEPAQDENEPAVKTVIGHDAFQRFD